MKIELQKHTLEALSRAVRKTNIPTQKVLESHQIRNLALNQVRMLEFYSGLSTKDHVPLICLGNFFEQWFVQENALC